MSEFVNRNNMRTNNKYSKKNQSSLGGVPKKKEDEPKYLPQPGEREYQPGDRGGTYGMNTKSNEGQRTTKSKEVKRPVRKLAKQELSKAFAATAKEEPSYSLDGIKQALRDVWDGAVAQATDAIANNAVRYQGDSSPELDYATRDYLAQQNRSRSASETYRPVRDLETNSISLPAKAAPVPVMHQGDSSPLMDTSRQNNDWYTPEEQARYDATMQLIKTQQPQVRSELKKEKRDYSDEMAAAAKAGEGMRARYSAEAGKKYGAEAAARAAAQAAQYDNAFGRKNKRGK